MFSRDQYMYYIHLGPMGDFSGYLSPDSCLPFALGLCTAHRTCANFPFAAILQ